MAEENGGTKLAIKNFNTILMYAVTLGVGTVALKTFSTSEKLNKIEASQISRGELDTKLGEARGELGESLNELKSRQEKITDKQDKMTEVLSEIRVEIARISPKEDVSKPHH